MASIMKISFGLFVQYVALFAFLCGTYKHFVLKESGNCAMTYMYQMPQYIPIRLSKQMSLQFPSYGLYVYGEGSYARSLENGNYDGIPVLFLPGNSGSYKQVRSLASVSMTKANENRIPFHFNYFAADFNEELSALYGNFLIKQTEFVSLCIRTILDLYKDNDDGPHRSPPTSVIVIGHSMGGVVARALFTLPQFDPDTVQLIVTQATPHSEPVFSSDLQMDRFYARVDEQWSRSNQRRRNNGSSSSGNVNVVSISGGPLDLIVRPDLIDLDRFESNVQTSSSSSSSNAAATVSLMSNSIPGVWIGMDHLCIVWCNQLVLATVRTIFKLIDPTTKQLMTKANKRRAVIDWNLVRGHHRTRTVDMPRNWAVPLAYEELWTERRTPGHWEYDGKQETSALLLTMTNVGDDLVVVASHLDLEPWIFACVPDDGRAICYVSHSLSCSNTYLPSKSGITTKAFYCRNVRETHIVIKLESNPSHNIEVFVESFPRSKSTYEAASYWQSFVSDQTVSIVPGSLFARIGFSALSETWQTYTLTVRSTSNGKCKLGVVHQYVPWAKVDTFTVLDDDDVVHHHSVALYSQRPTNINTKLPLEVRFYLDPTCSYDVSVSYSLIDTLQQVIRFYVHLVPAFVCASTFDTMASQTSNIGSKRFGSGILLLPVRNLVIVYVSTTVLKWATGDTIVVVGSKHYDRWLSFPVSYFLYVVSSAIVNILTSFVRVSLIPTRNLFRRLLRNTKLRSSRRTVFVANILLISLLTTVGHFTCGVVSLLATQLIFMVKLFRHELKDDKEKEREMKRVLYAICYLMWSLVFLIHCPALVVWIVNLRFQPVNPDPTLILSYVMLVSLFGRANFVDDLYGEAKFGTGLHLSRIQTVFAILVLMFGLERIYVVAWFLATDCLLLSFVSPLVTSRNRNVTVVNKQK